MRHRHDGAEPNGSLELKDLFNEGNGQLTLGGNRSAIELIERHKQRAHFAIEALEQEAADVFRHLKPAQPRAQL